MIKIGKTIAYYFLTILITSSCSAQIDENLVITNVSIIDIENNQLIKNQSVYISNGVIEKITDKLSIFDKSYSIINGEGKYIIPGLIDSHVHTTAGEESEMLKSLKQTLKGGITTVRDMGGDVMVIKKWQAKETDKIPTILTSAVFAGNSWMSADPRAKASAHNMEVGNIAWLRSINNNDSIPFYIKEAKSFGVDGIKIYADLSAKTVKLITENAKSNKLNVWSHSTIFPIGPTEAINSGVKVLSHVERLLSVLDTSLSDTYHSDRYVNHSYEQSQLQSEKIKQLINIMVKKDVYLDATLFVTKLKAERNTNNKEQLNLIYQFTSQLHKANVQLLAGTDAMCNRQTYQPNLHEELMLLVNKCNITPYEALKTATINPANAFKLNNVGAIKENYRADILILNSNPLDDISSTKDIFVVIKSGKIIK